jgi:hypothetical protein
MKILLVIMELLSRIEWKFVFLDEEICQTRNKPNGACADERVASIGCGTADVSYYPEEHSLRPAVYDCHTGSSDSYHAVKL